MTLSCDYLTALALGNGLNTLINTDKSGVVFCELRTCEDAPEETAIHGLLL